MEFAISAPTASSKTCFSPASPSHSRVYITKTIIYKLLWWYLYVQPHKDAPFALVTHTTFDSQRQLKLKTADSLYEHFSIIAHAPGAGNARGFQSSTYCSSSYIIVFNTTRFTRWEQCHADCLSLMNLQPFRLPNVFVPGVPTALSRYICPHTRYRRAIATPPGLLRKAATPCKWRNRFIFCYHLNENSWNQIVTKSAAVEYDKFLIVVLLNQAEYRKRQTVRSISSKMSLIHGLYFSKIAPRNWSPWNVIDCCNRDRKLTITTQRHKTCSQRCSTLVTAECWISSR
jgi:hypothetical protein